MVVVWLFVVGGFVCVVVRGVSVVVALCCQRLFILRCVPLVVVVWRVVLFRCLMFVVVCCLAMFVGVVVCRLSLCVVVVCCLLIFVVVCGVA